MANPVIETFGPVITIPENVGKLRKISSTPLGEHLIVHNARVSSKFQDKEDVKGLLSYCLREGHVSVFEQADMTVEIICPLFVAIQILRHWSFRFQQFCIAGDTKIYFDSPKAVANNKRKLMTQSIKELYDKWQKPHLRKRLKKMFIRVYDEQTNTLSHSHIKEVFQTGIKPIYEITLANGHKIKTTKEHKFLTTDGFKSLQEAIGLEHIGNKVTMSKEAYLGCNGQKLYQNKEWLKQAKQESILNGSGLSGIANLANVSKSTISRYLKKHNISFTTNEVSQYHNPGNNFLNDDKPWNFGKFGYSTKSATQERKDKISKAISGSNNGNWKGGVSREWRQTIWDEVNKVRPQLLEMTNYTCQECNKKSNKLEIHHIIPVNENPYLATTINNLLVVCKNCHNNLHNKRNDYQTWRNTHDGNTLTVEYSKVISVKYIGEEMTYDLEVEHTSHNYVANKIITHNSQRYQDIQLLGEFAYVPQKLRSQDTKNRQNSLPWEGSLELEDELIKDIIDLYDHIRQVYRKLLDNGVAKELARTVLPEGVTTKLYMKGNVRSWMSYLKVRSEKGVVQHEHRLLAETIFKEIFAPEFPIIASMMNI